MLESLQKHEIADRVVARIVVNMVDVATWRNPAMVIFKHDAVKSHALALEITAAPIIPDAIKFLDGV